MHVFQSTRPHGARQETSGRRASSRVSIHAPARGATCRLENRRDRPLFRSTRPHGARTLRSRIGRRKKAVSIHAPARGATAWPALAPRASKFRSTRPHGARLERAGRDASDGCFDPRARTGRDTCMILEIAADVSIHAPARGATTLSANDPHSVHVSIHAPARGATLQRRMQTEPFDVSIHAPARGATFVELRRESSRAFQSTRPHGARRSTS